MNNSIKQHQHNSGKKHCSEWPLIIYLCTWKVENIQKIICAQSTSLFLCVSTFWILYFSVFLSEETQSNPAAYWFHQLRFHFLLKFLFGCLTIKTLHKFFRLTLLQCYCFLRCTSCTQTHWHHTWVTISSKQVIECSISCFLDAPKSLASDLRAKRLGTSCRVNQMLLLLLGFLDALKWNISKTYPESSGSWNQK